HDGRSRALRIFRSHNGPGFPDGIAGPELIGRMTRHAAEFGARLDEAEVPRSSEPDGVALICGRYEHRGGSNRYVDLGGEMTRLEERAVAYGFDIERDCAAYCRW